MRKTSWNKPGITLARHREFLFLTTHHPILAEIHPKENRHNGRYKKGELYKMKKTGNSNKTIKSRLLVFYGLNAHKWATKMEVRRLLSGKPDLELKADPKKNQ
jgi:hypothetical protein